MLWARELLGHELIVYLDLLPGFIVAVTEWYGDLEELDPLLPTSCPGYWDEGATLPCPWPPEGIGSLPLELQPFPSTLFFPMYRE